MGHYTHLFIYRLILCLPSKILQSIYKIKEFFFFFFNSPHHIEDTQAGSDHEHAEDFEVSFLLLTLFSKN